MAPNSSELTQADPSQSQTEYIAVPNKQFKQCSNLKSIPHLALHEFDRALVQIAIKYVTGFAGTLSIYKW